MPCGYESLAKHHKTFCSEGVFEPLGIQSTKLFLITCADWLYLLKFWFILYYFDSWDIYVQVVNKTVSFIEHFTIWTLTFALVNFKFVLMRFQQDFWLKPVQNVSWKYNYNICCLLHKPQNFGKCCLLQNIKQWNKAPIDLNTRHSKLYG